MSACTIQFGAPLGNDGSRMANDEWGRHKTAEVPAPTEQERLIYRRVKFDGEKQTEIARQLGINQSTVSRAISRYERWIAAGGQEQEAGLPHGERLRAQRWLTFERNEWILSAALRIAAAMERECDTSRSTITSSGAAPSTTKEVRTEYKIIDRSGIAARFLRLAWRINMDQLRLAEEEPEAGMTKSE